MAATARSGGDCDDKNKPAGQRHSHLHLKK
jgi:hypothetical protein